MDDKYDHDSMIGQPAKFAHALCRMVADQIGPQGKISSFKWTHVDGKLVQTHHNSQLVMHGPVVYADRPYDMITQESDDAKKLAKMIFVKSTEFSAQHEYRFAIMNEGAEEETVQLEISGMMRDALKQSKGEKIRTKPAASDGLDEDEDQAIFEISVSSTVRKYTLPC